MAVVAKAHARGVLAVTGIALILAMLASVPVRMDAIEPSAY
jgi:hypothetical protein